MAGRLRLDLAQYRELAAFSQLASDLDPQTQARLSRGRLLTEILKQPAHSLYTLWQQAASIYAATEGAFDGVAIENVKAAQEATLLAIDKKHPKLVAELQAGDKPTEVAKKTILNVAQAVAKGYQGEKK